MSSPSTNKQAEAQSIPFHLSVGFTENEFKRFLRQCVHAGSSDITIQSGDYVWGEIKRRHTPVTNRRIDGSEAERAVRYLYGATGMSQMAGKSALDFEYEITEVEGTFDDVMRFRCNATACRVGEIGSGVSITMRVIPGVPPAWEALSLPEDITDTFFPQYGLVLVIGTTGSGKSTLLGSGNRRRLERTDQPVKIITFEDPIELVYTGLAADRMPQPSQVQIHTHLNSFDDAGRNAMLRKADVIVMGESRDRESVSTCFEMALSGHAVYSTLHADTPAETFARMVSFFPEDSQPAAANKLLDTLKLIVAQKLQRKTDGTVAAIRSWLVIDREVKRRLSLEPFYKWGTITNEILTEQGKSFEAQSAPLFAQGLIDFEAFRHVTNMTTPEAVSYITKCGAEDKIPQSILDEYEIDLKREQK